MSKRSIYNVYDYEANTGNYDPIAPLAKIKPLPDPDVSGKVLVSVANSTETNSQWTSTVTLDDITSSTGRIVSLRESELDRCKVVNSNSTIPGVVKYTADKFKYVGDDGSDWVVNAYKSTDPPPIPSGAYTVGIGGAYSNLKQAADHFNDLSGDETITLILLNDLVVEQNIVLKRNYLIQSRYDVPYKLIVDFTNQPAFNGNIIRFMYPTESSNYQYTLKLKNIYFDIRGNDFANNTSRFLYNYHCVDAGSVDKYCHVDIDSCKFVFTGKHNFGLINVFGTLNLSNSYFDIDRQPIYEGPIILGTIHIQDDATKIDSYYSQFIKLYFDNTVDGEIRSSTFKNNEFNFNVSRPVDRSDSEVQGMCPIQPIYCNIKSNYSYTLNCEFNHHFVRAHCGNTPWVPFSGGYDFRDDPDKDWLWYRKLTWQLCNYCMEGQFNFRSDSEEFNFYLYSMNNYATGSIGRRILPVAPFSLSLVNNNNTPRINVTDYQVGFTGSLIKAEINNGYYPFLNKDTPRVTPYQNNYGLYQFAHIIGAGATTKDSTVWSRISLFNYLGSDAGYNNASIRAILFNAVTSDNGEQSRLMDTVKLDLISNTRDIVDSGVIPSLSSNVTSLTTSVNNNTSSINSLTTTVNNNTTSINTLNTNVSANTSSINTLNTNVSTNTSNITSLTTTVNSNTSRLDTLDSRINQNVNTTSNPSFAGITTTGTSKVKKLQIGDSTDTDASRFITALDNAQPTNSDRFFNFGKSNSAGDQAELGYRYAGVANGSNEVFLGFHSYKALSCFYDGRVRIPGAIQLVNNTNTALNVTGALNWNGTTNVPRFYNGTSWNDIATQASLNTTNTNVSNLQTTVSSLQTSSEIGKLFASRDMVLAKSDQGSFGWDNVHNTFGPTFTVFPDSTQGNSFFWVQFNSDPNCNLTCMVMDMGRSQNITPYDFQWRIKRENTLNFKLEAVKGSPAWNDLNNFSGGVLNINTIMANTASIYLRIMFFRTS